MPSNTVKLLEQVLDLSTLKQKVIGKNIANVATVGYKREKIEFDEVLQNANAGLKRTDERHFKISAMAENPDVPFKVEKDQNKENISGMNNVDINQEMAEMAKNSIMFKFAARKINGYYQSISNVIKGA
ncbi:MAG: flagellar basal body rod protein FlgB [Ignavibacteria bacterium]|nr:flagellar basal body rod protein FlgB [Ignavibacteria bacterium]